VCFPGSIELGFNSGPSNVSCPQKYEPGAEDVVESTGSERTQAPYSAGKNGAGCVVERHDLLAREPPEPGGEPASLTGGLAVALGGDRRVLYDLLPVRGDPSERVVLHTQGRRRAGRKRSLVVP
jgi:hypothetical protein